jgi:ABC-type uncharacterized transport system permease subunit
LLASDRSVIPIVVLACYLAGALWLASSVHRPDEHAARGRRIAGIALGVLAVVLHAFLLWGDVFMKASWSFTIAEAASLIALPIGGIAVLFSWLRPRFAAIGAALMAFAGAVAVSTIRGEHGYALERQNWEIAAHIALSVLAYALLTVAVALALALALLDRRLRTRRPLGWMKVLPSMEALEAGTFQALFAGFSILTLALFSGFIFVEDLFAQHLIHKTVLSCLAWAVFAVLLFGRWRFGWRGRTAASWTMSGFALLALAYFGSKIVLESILGRHWG